MARKSKLYALIDPRTGLLRYIGKTQLDLKSRLRAHIGDAKRRSNRRANWIKAVLKAGLKPEIELLDEADDGCAVEQAMIGIARSLGCNLVNGTDGGEGVPGRKHSAETKAKIGAGNRGKSKSGWKQSPEARAKISAGNKGKPKSAEHRAKSVSNFVRARFFKKSLPEIAEVLYAS